MPGLTIYGANNASIELEGVIYDEYLLGADGTWTAKIRTPNGDYETVRVTFQQDNPEGWDVKVIDAFHQEQPWSHSREIRTDLEFGNVEDFYITMDVPTDAFVELVL